MRRRRIPNFIGSVVELEERQARIERIMRIVGFSPEKPYTLTVNDGTRNRVEIGVVDGDYGIKIVDNAGAEIILANGTVNADAIKTGTLDASIVNVTNINANNIVSGTIEADYIVGGTLDASTMTVQNLNAGSITVGTFVNINDRLSVTSIHGDKIQVGTLNADRITAGSISANEIHSHTITGNEISFGTLTGSHLDVRTISADRIQTNVITTNEINYIGGSKLVDSTVTNAKILSISAAKITAGTLTVGSGGATAVYIKRQSGDPGSNAYLRWEGNTRIWTDSSNRLGINSIGSPMYVYVDSSQRIIIPSSGQTTIEGGANLKGNFNVSDNYASHFTGEVRLDTNYIRFSHATGAKILTVNDMGVTFYKDGDDRGGLSWANGADLKVDKTGKWFKINGNAKEAVVPTSKGHKALYCIESPEVWFMDFCEKIDGEYQIDPTFEEVTKPPYRFMRTEEKGIYQVWGKRKGHEKKRFEKRTKKQFRQNEKFLTLPKRM
ncbi:MAG: hypothetical protein U9O78_02695 [Patescibacteria group bacterium]|nr:hypothetical protein [Patescibacteria group bacterium]